MPGWELLSRVPMMRLSAPEKVAFALEIELFEGYTPSFLWDEGERGEAQVVGSAQSIS